MSAILIGPAFLLICLIGFALLRATKQGVTVEWMRNFIWSSAGASPEILLTCQPSVRLWYTALGSVLVMIGVLSAVAMATAMHVIGFGTWAFITGLFWGALVLLVDRLMLASIGRVDRFWVKLVKAVPRALLTVVISLLVSELMVQVILDKDLRREAIAIRKEEVKAGYKNELEDLRERIEVINKELDGLNQRKGQQQKDYAREVSGTGGSGKRGTGPIAKELREGLASTEAEIGKRVDEKAVKEQRLAEIREAIDLGMDKAAVQHNAPVEAGLLARAKALNSLCQRDPYANLLRRLLVWALLLIELTPMVTKLLKHSDQYDDKIASERRFRSASARRMSRVIDSIADGRANNVPSEERDIAEAVANAMNDYILTEIAGLKVPVQQPGAVTEPSANSAVRVYMANPGSQDERRSLVIGFALPPDQVLGQHLIEGVNQALIQAGSELWNGAPFKAVSHQGNEIRADQGLFRQLGLEATVYVIPAAEGAAGTIH